MEIFQQTFFIIGAILGLLGVAAGAFGSHALKLRIPADSLHVFEVAARYQMYHALVLISLVAIMQLFPSLWFVWAGWLLIVGVVIFSGSLYALVLSSARFWGAITSIGGFILSVGWLLLLLGGIFNRF
jgi:uncharacterized membrane protein YgdD (TMEM256/DUF423 family)